MTNKVIPIRKIPLKLGVLAAARRALVLKAGELEISVEITAEARLLRVDSPVPSQIQSKVLPIRQLGVKERSDDSRN